MDPATALFNMITEALKLCEKVIDGQPPEVKARLWELHLKNIEDMQILWEKLIGAVKFPSPPGQP